MLNLRTKDFYFDLPQELIAQKPLKNRDESRLMLLNKTTGEVEHSVFKNISDILSENDVLVVNNTRVIPARLIGTKFETEGKVEALLLNRLSMNTWEALTKPAKRLKVGTKISFGDGLLEGEVVDVLEEGKRVIKFKFEGVFEEILDKLGKMPLPPYITHQLEDKERYQTVYSKISGSAAAPTAGLHFTNELMEKIKNKGTQIEFITLHVGLGTFRPVMTDNIKEHNMHSEYYEIEENTLKRLNDAKKNGKRIICVGTTSVRTLESASENGLLVNSSGWTNIFIYPPYKFQFVDSIITNFHLPESTLIMMISAFAGKENTLNAYKNAIEEKYRFFSFGDAMYIF